ncbi:MAG: YebC/PmpR family DNA-binding transcriptional regulator [Candidatus Lloydbacteria bacterium CG22_combo_CG10-13_8_21_14_all_47_15]|uniref:YebC/PmpR family DNA-binding transcriptional regulator n=1 Tax=Candidatus Lloydbacteria bacterium CG22_combo_CG10-13_8_21_14_all_47_15 TaxID=1974635 RepID=A0A2H0CUP1_9BACT|nr:MAG: YebC/PmpR family DNA-binding transcriptional regulator [Candidatus Lloydbacteria bacterium CG22_combo_CG10-13_8_21_14_all_47_15]
MSGHNKWSKIKHKKAATDAKKSKIFGKLVRLIQTESRQAFGDTSAPNLRAAIEKAKKENMPADNIDRAVKKGVGGEGGEMESLTYEAYGPGGVAIIIVALTDNRNKAAAELKHILSKHSASLAAPGAASWAFTNKDGAWIPNQTTTLSDEDIEKLERLVDDIEENDEVQSVSTNAE